MPSVVFDLDGTLADTSGDLLNAANVCFRDMGHGDVLNLKTDRGIALRGARAMLTAGLRRLEGVADPAVVNRYYPFFLDVYRDNIDRHTVFYDGALDAVETLKSAGYPVGICTNKPEALADLLLNRLNARDAFQALVGADTLPVRKPDPEPLIECVRRLGRNPHRALLVGDTDTDRETARRAGVPSILVTFGPSGGDMAALSPEALLSDYADLPDLVTSLIGPGVR